MWGSRCAFHLRLSLSETDNNLNKTVESVSYRLEDLKSGAVKVSLSNLAPITFSITYVLADFPSVGGLINSVTLGRVCSLLAIVNFYSNYLCHFSLND